MIHVRRRGFLSVLVGIIIASGGLTAAYGPLVPWSPLHPGYDELPLSRARVLYPSGTQLPDAYRNADRWIADAERFHELAVRKRITIVLCSSWRDFHRFVPWIRGQAVAGVSLATGDAIYITPKVDEKHLEHEEFLRHEISHIVLAQNASLMDAYSGPHQHPWLHEGLAVWFARQRAFVTQAEFFERAPALGVSAAIESRGSYGGTDLRFGYVAWRNFLDYLDQTHGHEMFIAFVKAANQHPGDTDALFASAFSVTFDDAAARFEMAVLTHTFVPRP